MTRTILAVAAVLAMGCAGGEQDGDWPAVEGLYSMDVQGVACQSTVAEQAWPDSHQCVWERATLNGEPHCRVAGYFYQPDESGGWAVVFGSSDEGCSL